MEVSKVLKDAWQAVETADVPAEMHEVAFREAIRILAPPTDSGEAQQGRRVGKPDGKRGLSGSDRKPKEDGAGGLTVDESVLISKVAEGTGCDPELLDQLIHINDGRLEILIPGLRLGKKNSDKVRNISKIFSIVYAFGLGEDGAAVELIRSEVQRLKCYDNTNFSKQMAGLAPQFAVTGQGASKMVRPKSSGISNFAELVESIAGSAS